MNFKIPKSAASMFLAFLLSACNPKVAQVGTYSIYKKDVDCRNAILNLLEPYEDRKLGLTQLIRAYQYAQILKNHGREVTPQILADETSRINARTLYPEKLSQIKKACTEESYERAYILPVYVERILYFDFFLKNATIQAPSLNKPQWFLEKTLAEPRSFEKIAKSEGLGLSALTISPYSGLQWKQPNTPENSAVPAQSPPQLPPKVSQRLNAEQEVQTSKEGKKWIEEIIKPLKPGSVSPRIIDSQDSWMIVKYLGASKTSKSSYELKAVLFPKRNFSEWIESETKLIPR